jgi:hypothetical protein
MNKVHQCDTSCQVAKRWMALAWQNYSIRKSLSLFSLFAILVALLLTQSCAGYLGSRVETYPAVTVADIIKMSQEKVPADKIIHKMRESHTVYRLKADQYAKLKEEGVPDPVLNYMQKTYINAVRHNQALEDYNYWWPGWDGYWYGGPAFGWPNWGWGVGFGGDDFFDNDRGEEGEHQGEGHEGHERR